MKNFCALFVSIFLSNLSLGMDNAVQANFLACERPIESCIIDNDTNFIVAFGSRIDGINNFKDFHNVCLPKKVTIISIPELARHYDNTTGEVIEKFYIRGKPYNVIFRHAHENDQISNKSSIETITISSILKFYKAKQRKKHCIIL